MFLKGPDGIAATTQELIKRDLIPNLACPPKNWDLFLSLIQLSDGNILDMGCQGAVVLQNALKMGLKGEKFGIDFVDIPPVDGIIYKKGNLTNTGFSKGFFDFITCLSVIEHGVNPDLFFLEASRILKPGGKLMVSFDYWDPKKNSNAKPFGLPWSIFCRSEVEDLIAISKAYGFGCQVEDWSIDKPVIFPGYFSPCEHSYTFGFLTFTHLS